MSDRGAAGAHCLDLSALHGTRGATGTTGATGATGASAGHDETHVGAEARNRKWAFDKKKNQFIIVYIHDSYMTYMSTHHSNPHDINHCFTMVYSTIRVFPEVRMVSLVLTLVQADDGAAHVS